MIHGIPAMCSETQSKEREPHNKTYNVTIFPWKFETITTSSPSGMTPVPTQSAKQWCVISCYTLLAAPFKEHQHAQRCRSGLPGKRFVSAELWSKEAAWKCLQSTCVNPECCRNRTNTKLSLQLRTHTHAHHLQHPLERVSMWDYLRGGTGTQGSTQNWPWLFSCSAGWLLRDFWLIGSKHHSASPRREWSSNSTFFQRWQASSPGRALHFRKDLNTQSGTYTNAHRCTNSSLVCTQLNTLGFL